MLFIHLHHPTVYLVSKWWDFREYLNRWSDPEEGDVRVAAGAGGQGTSVSPFCVPVSTKPSPGAFSGVPTSGLLGVFARPVP